ncbi:MAG: HAD family hydrolase [Candidatus Micrarchaeota archaeon]|nr:HAD family hydrolase [Candidatus Micrarchaeota archaeon]
MSSVNRFGLVVFDLDGTLVDNRAGIKVAFDATLDKFGLPRMSDMDIYAGIGKPILERFETELPVSRDTALEMTDYFRSVYLSKGHTGVALLDGAEEALRRIRGAGIKTGLATTKGNNGTQMLLRETGLDRYFDLALGLTKEFRPKPYPDMIEHVMDRLGVPKERTAYVGDTPIDMAAARNAGVFPIAVKTGIALGITDLEELEESKPGMMIGTLRELPGALGI